MRQTDAIDDITTMPRQQVIWRRLSGVAFLAYPRTIGKKFSEPILQARSF
jgi:hypothetical protein